MTLEEKFAKLEETVTRLESEEVSLEESFRIYKEGMALLIRRGGRRFYAKNRGGRIAGADTKRK